MLSKLSNLVLGLIWKRPLNPYEITKLMERSEIQDWFPMTSASIYTTIRNLSSKGYIVGETISEGNLPPKTMYSLTKKGEEALINSLEIGLETYKTEASNFGISLFHICSLNKDNAIDLLKKRLNKLKNIKFKADKKLNTNTNKIPINFRMMLKYNVYRIEIEIKITEELIAEAQNDSNWNSSFVKLLD
ncbi:MAG: PadR family transcriptional regulator [Clostridium sp.]|uniref:PadR family transcriptional regulator n=1 Tax=Clostridium sp. TaxID=1506 RepID=UPI0039E93000